MQASFLGQRGSTVRSRAWARQSTLSAKSRGHFKTAFSGQHYIEHHRIERLAAEAVKSGIAIRLRADFMALGLQFEEQTLREIGFVFDDEDACHGLFLPQKQGEDTGELETDGGASAFAFALGGGVAAVLARDGAHQIEAEAGALGAQHGAAGNAVKAAEDALEMGCGDADALIGDADADQLVSDAQRNDAGDIAHVQVADVPGRGAPGTGQLDYQALFRQLAGQGYRGWIGCEYQPSDPADSSTSFGWR